MAIGGLKGTKSGYEFTPENLNGTQTNDLNEVDL